MIRVLVAVIAFSLVGSIANAVEPSPASLQQSGLATPEICAGDIVSPDGASVSFERIVADAIKQGVLLGERHGVKDHPLAAACLVRRISQTRPATVVLEMVPAQLQTKIDAYRKAHPELIDGLGVELTWWKSGWPSWQVYAPLFEAAWWTRSGVVAGDVAANAKFDDRDTLIGAFGPDFGRAQASWAEAMKTAHCNLIDDTKAGELANRQMTRDLHMAAKVSAARNGAGPVVLYSGRAHVRSDRSVGYLLRRGTPNLAAPLSIALVETAMAGVVTDRAKVLAEAKGRYDYIWFTGTADRPDACERLRSKGLIPIAGVQGGGR
jgi:Haem-binding uptake, Tiki superfamily, ChaN